jgi:hypothetical protein
MEEKMIGVVLATMILTAIVTGALTWLWVRRPRPLMPTKQQVLLSEAMALFYQLLHPTNLDPDGMDLLSKRSRERASTLWARYQKEVTDK